MKAQPQIILASQSPRRKQLLQDLGYAFEVITKHVDEDFPDQLEREKIPEFLADKKAEALRDALTGNNIIIAADTIVWINNKVLNKPSDAEEAKKMLLELSGKMHQVFTGVCVLSAQTKKVFSCETKVYFKSLSDLEISHYIKNYHPFDKAGAYGAQEWMGYIAIEKIEGSYFNVMGLPVKELHEVLVKLIPLEV